jgi:hypothetical protein
MQKLTLTRDRNGQIDFTSPRVVKALSLLLEERGWDARISNTVKQAATEKLKAAAYALRKEHNGDYFKAAMQAIRENPLLARLDRGESLPPDARDLDVEVEPEEDEEDGR